MATVVSQALSLPASLQGTTVSPLRLQREHVLCRPDAPTPPSALGLRTQVALTPSSPLIFMTP